MKQNLSQVYAVGVDNLTDFCDERRKAPVVAEPKTLAEAQQTLDEVCQSPHWQAFATNAQSLVTAFTTMNLAEQFRTIADFIEDRKYDMAGLLTAVAYRRLDKKIPRTSARYLILPGGSKPHRRKKAR